jgi:RimJ/RimL family protein N-acetyltransferase
MSWQRKKKTSLTPINLTPINPSLTPINMTPINTISQLTMTRTNELGQRIGDPVPDWRPPPPPAGETLAGRWCRVERLDPGRHCRALFEANRLDAEHRIWTYLPYGPFESLEAYRAWVESDCLGDDPMFHAIVDAATGQATGVASYLRIDSANGVIEVGHINFSPLLQQTPAATEAMFLMMKHVFELGYRRYEWKCDALNDKSCAAARRLGFTFEGVFRQATIYKGRNRDTAWFSILDSEWPACRDAFERWLDPSNFDGQGRQRRKLGSEKYFS